MLHHGRVDFIRYYWSDTAHAHDSIFVLSAPAGANQSFFSHTKYMSLPLSGEIIVAACGGSCEDREKILSCSRPYSWLCVNHEKISSGKPGARISARCCFPSSFVNQSSFTLKPWIMLIIEIAFCELRVVTYLLYFNIGLFKITPLNLIQFEIIFIIISRAQQFTGQYSYLLKTHEVSRTRTSTLNERLRIESIASRLICIRPRANISPATTAALRNNPIPGDTPMQASRLQSPRETTDPQKLNSINYDPDSSKTDRRICSSVTESRDETRTAKRVNLLVRMQCARLN